MSGRWRLGSEVKHSSLPDGAMLYDGSRVGNLNATWFDPQHWQRRGEIEGSGRGRGSVHYVRADGRRFVLRHYRRGGLAASVSSDRYLWQGEAHTRPFAEWQLTYRLHRAGLPVPAPLAARYRRTGLVYTGDIITERLNTVGTLTECLATGALSILTWIGIGRCIRRFHDLGVCHADLNAHNLLLNEDAKVYMIDFDQCQLRRPGMWRDGNLVRLRRSLEKVTYSLPRERFGEADWYGLLDGYRQPSGDQPLQQSA